MTFECRRTPLAPTTPVTPDLKAQGLAYRTARIERSVPLQRAALYLGGIYLMSALADIEAGRSSPDTIPGFAGYVSWLSSLPLTPRKELPDWLRNDEHPSPSAAGNGDLHRVPLP